jgi:tetratricopeptide (TPR) repeat protein
VLTRPELLDKRPNWGAGHRNFTSLHLGPLSEKAMTELLDGFVPGLPDELREQILARAEGVPLYAVETVRMLIDRGLLVEEGSVYRPTGEIPSLEVPETLHGLVASRLDGLPPEERRLLQDAAVLGKTFTRQGLAAVGGLAEAELDPLLASLARKEILGVQADPTSPEHGQYGFLQDLVRHVAYETLSKKERRARHLAAAAHLEAAFANEDEIAEVLASHYVDAYAALPDAEDAAEVKAKAARALVHAGDRAESLGAAGEAVRYLAQAAELTDEPLDRAALLDRAGWLGVYVPDYDQAASLLAESISLYETAGDVRSAARVSGKLAGVETFQDHWEEAIARAEAALEALRGFEPGAELAELAARLAGGYRFVGESQKALEMSEFAIGLAESLGSVDVVARAFSAKALAIEGKRPEEALALRKHQLSLTREHDLAELEGNALFNLSDLCFGRDRYEDALSYLADALVVMRRRGARAYEWSVLAETTYPLCMLGLCDEALAAFAEVPEDRLLDALTTSFLSSIPEIRIHRGDVSGARGLLDAYSTLGESADLQDKTGYDATASAVARAEGRLDEALALGSQAAEVARAGSETNQSTKLAIVEAIEAAIGLGEHAKTEELVSSIEAVPPGLRSRYLTAQALRFRARLATSDEAATESFEAAAGRFRELGVVFWLAVTLLEHGELTGDSVLLDDARELVEGLRATPWLQRLDVVQSVRTGVPA